VSFKNGEFSGLVTGYADETIPNKAIITGKIKNAGAGGQAVNSRSRNAPAGAPATLGLLALGSSGISIWRQAASLRRQD